jgi:hypothetical protein
MDVCFVGIDVSSKTFYVCIQRDQKLIEWELPNTPKGYTKLLKDLGSCCVLRSYTTRSPTREERRDFPLLRML